jgi:hypothetical protein
VDPCQGNATPLKTQTLIPAGAARTTADSIGLGALAGVFTGRESVTNNGFNALVDLQSMQYRVVGLANTDNVITLQVRNLAKSLAIRSVAAGGVATAALLVEASVDGTNYFTIDNPAAAATNLKQYTETTLGATTALSPLSFAFIRITGQAGGVSVVVTLEVGLK